MVMTKVSCLSILAIQSNCSHTSVRKVYGAVGRDFGMNLNSLGKNPDDIGYVNQHGLGRKHIFHSVKQSLERLQLDYIDLLQCGSQKCNQDATAYGLQVIGLTRKHQSQKL